MFLKKMMNIQVMALHSLDLDEQGQTSLKNALDENGITKCTIEQAFLDGKIDFKKPVSCHLYPIRIKEYETITAVNYEVWDICSDACVLGAQLKIPAYQFVKDGLIRRFGEEFYAQLDGAAKFKEEGTEE